MTDGDTGAAVREAVGVFSSAEALEKAAESLQSAGFDRSSLSLLATESAIVAQLGHRYEKVGELEDDPAVPRAAFVSRGSLGDAEGGVIGGLAYVGAVATAGAIVASGGAAAGALIAAALAGGAGGLVGSVLADIIDRAHAERMAHHLERGGLVLWVQTRDPAQEARAVSILRANGAKDAHVHSLPAR